VLKATVDLIVGACVVFSLYKSRGIVYYDMCNYDLLYIKIISQKDMPNRISKMTALSRKQHHFWTLLFGKESGKRPRAMPAKSSFFSFLPVHVLLTEADLCAQHRHKVV
jgi:hypothetical protein